MSNKFAKLFEVEDSQVLFLATKNDEDVPCLTTITSFNGLEVRMNSLYEDSDAGFDKRDKALEEVATQEYAETFYASLLEQFGSLSAEETP